jgi:two-component system, NarL family, sensor kinase
MLVELHPQELTGDNLGDLIATSAIRGCPDQQVSVTTDLSRPVSPEVAAFLYRCARECAINVYKHAKASRVDITLSNDEAGVRLLVRDDGIGLPDPGAVRTEGHLGLALLREAATDLGGTLELRNAEGGGTLVTIAVPNS